MTYAVYDIVTTCAAPAGALWLAVSPRYRPLLGRFSARVPDLPSRPVCFQACSVGEVGTAKPLTASFAARHPDIPILLTTSTLAGYAQASAPESKIPVAWFPFDQKLLVRRFLQRSNPRALVLLETELWPNVLRETRRRGIPSIVVNGRISDKHFKRYYRFRKFFRPMFAQISLAAMQNDEYAGRMAQLGVPVEAIHVTGNTKFDGVLTSVPSEAKARVRRENGFPQHVPVLVFGSTRPGDEALAAQCWRSLRTEFPDLHLVVAPRHPNRADEAAACFQEPVLRRSEVKRGISPSGQRVFLLDTVGELTGLYAIASAAVVGGSFYPGVNGHNPIEPAALAVPTLFGPYMRNFSDPARVLADCGGARQVSEAAQLLGELRSLLAHPDVCRAMADRGRAGVLANQGATERSLDLLDSVLGIQRA